jgi:thermitase
MRRKIVSGMMLSLLLIGMLTLAFDIQPAKAERTWAVDDDVPADLHTIREAIDAANPAGINQASMKRWSMGAIESDLEGGLGTRLMDVFQLPYEASGGWSFENEAEWGDFACVDDDSAELVIGLSDVRPNSHSQLVDLIVSSGGEIVDTVSMDGQMRAVVADIPHGPMATFVSEVAVAGLSRYIEPNMRFEVDFVPNDPDWPKQWGPRITEVDHAWNTTTGDSSVLVAVIDTGVDYDHPDLATNYVALGYDWVNNDTDPMDDHGHGTHCAGIIGAVINNSIGISGLAQVRIMAEKTFDQSGRGWFCDCAKGIIHAVEQGADILSNSWGGIGYSALLHDAIRYAHGHGVLVVASAGNSATSCKQYPAAYEEVVAVTATDKLDDSWNHTNFGDWVELAAPGVDIYSTWWDDSYRDATGTSMSAPHVSGVAALIWSQAPNMTRGQVRAQLRCTADDLGAPGFDVYYGYGRINARRAVEQALPEHDIVFLHWKVPCVLKTFDTATINSTLLNLGANNESALTVQLLVNNSVADYQVIDYLASGASTGVGCVWSPTIEGKYNVTLYVAPVDGETSTENNILSEYVIVRFAKIIVVPDDFPRIQKAINEVCMGYTIQVEPGTYYEHIIIDRSITLIGKNPSTTVIDGRGIESVIIVAAEQGNVNVSGFTLQNSGQTLLFDEGGIILYCSNNNVSGNTITNCGFGIGLFGSRDNTIVDNTVSNSVIGIYVERSGGNHLRNNHMTGNSNNFGVLGIDILDYINDIDNSNTVDEKPIYYWVNQHEGEVPADAGYVAVVNSTNIFVKSLNLTNNSQGILFAYTANSTITNVSVSNSGCGIELDESNNNSISGNLALENYLGVRLAHSNHNIIRSNKVSRGLVGIDLDGSSSNIISGNTVSDNTLYFGYGISLMYFSSNNMIFHNDFIDNTVQVFLSDSFNNTWDDGYPSGGNFWSDYSDVDLYYGPDQNETGNDGIWDHPYVIDGDNQDNYPLKIHFWYWSNPILGDVDFDGEVDMQDVYIVIQAFGSYPGQPRWNPSADIDKDDRISMRDIYLVITSFGKTY